MLAPVSYEFRLYVAGEAPNSAQALANLTALCLAQLPDCHRIEVIDVFQHPRRALDDGVLMTPMLLKLSPDPKRRIVGTLAQTRAVMLALGLDSPP